MVVVGAMVEVMVMMVVVRRRYYLVHQQPIGLQVYRMVGLPEGRRGTTTSGGGGGGGGGMLADAITVM